MKNLLVICLFLFLFSCTKKPTDLANEPNLEMNFEKELQDIEALRASFSLALKEGRYKDLGQWITKDAKSVRAGGPGFDEMFAIGKDRGTFPYDSIVMTPKETMIMNDSMAYDWGSSKTYYTNNEGATVELDNSFLVILKKESGQWKLHREVASSILEDTP